MASAGALGEAGASSEAKLPAPREAPQRPLPRLHQPALFPRRETSTEPQRGHLMNPPNLGGGPVLNVAKWPSFGCRLTPTGWDYRAANSQTSEKPMAANLFAAGDFGGKCERGLPPFTFGARRQPRADAGAEATGVGATRLPVAFDSAISDDQSELAAARRRRAREFRLPARSAGRSPDGGLTQPLRGDPDLFQSMAPSGDRST